MRRWLSQATQIVFSPVCLLCGARDHTAAMDLCAPCARDLPGNCMACARCAEPLAAPASSMVCGECLRQPPRVTAAYTAFRYEFPVDHLLRGLKYSGQLANAQALGELLAKHLRAVRSDTLPECVIPVPLGEQRFRERGFNQANEIGRTVAKRLQIPLRADVVARVRETPVQAGLDRAARRKNLRKAFVVSETFAHQHVAILDDVVTTGSTANEMARVLLQAGAKQVELWAVAKVA